MKKIFAPLLILLAFFSTTQCFSAGQGFDGGGENFQSTLPYHQDILKEYTVGFFYADPIELTEDDTNDSEDEDCSDTPPARENQYLVYTNFYASFSKAVYFNPCPHAHRFPIYILFRSFRV